MPILHRTRTLPALMPRFVQRFSCIGPACEDTCCSGWKVLVDKKTYKAYRKEAVPALDRLMANMIRLDDQGSDSNAFAAIGTLGPQKQCPALDNGICSVQASLGESYLPNVCHIYPRTNRRMDGQIEQMITLSCPEAARLALLAEDAFDFVEAPIQLRESAMVEVGTCFGVTPAMMAEVRIFCLNLMRTRELELWQRLALLGTFCDALTVACAQNRQADIPALIDDFMRAVGSGELTATLDVIQPDHDAQAMVFATLWATKGFESTSPFQQGLMNQISARFGANANGQVSAEALVGAYRRGLVRLDQTMAQTPWLLENYVMNEMFSQLVPFSGHTPYDSFLQLVARYGLLRLLLAIQCNTDEEVGPVMLTSTVQLHCRRFQHDPNYARRVKQSLYESGWAEMSKLYMLLRT